MEKQKGISHRKWTKEEKLKFVKLHLEEHKSLMQIEKEYSVRRPPKILCNRQASTV